MPVTASKRTSAQILRDIKALPFSKLDKLVPKIMELRVQKHPHVMSPREEWLQKQIEAGLPPELRSAWAEVLKLRGNRGETKAWQRRRLTVVQQMEEFNVTWLEWAVELASLRGVTVARLLKDLDISRPGDVCF